MTSSPVAVSRLPVSPSAKQRGLGDHGSSNGHALLFTARQLSWQMRSLSPTVASASMARRLCSRRRLPAYRNSKATFLHAVNWGMSLQFWNTEPVCWARMRPS